MNNHEQLSPKFYQKLEEMKGNEPTIGPELEHTKKPIPTGQLESSWASNQSLLGSQDYE